MTTTYTQLPVWIAVTFAECGCHAQLRVSANNDKSLAITVIHETLLDVIAHDIAGNEIIENLDVQDNETLTMLVRNSISEIIACGVFGVDLSLIEKLGAPLRPVLSSNLFVDQCERRVIVGATNRAMTTLAEVTR